jgi:serine/threonine-protein kinase
MSMPTPSADHNLIFGLLALQMEFVNREQLLEAMNAWMLRKATPLGEVLRERGVLNERRLELLHGLVEEHVQQHGDAQASLAALCVEASVRQDLGRLNDADVQASLVSLPDAPPETRDPRAVPGALTSSVSWPALVSLSTAAPVSDSTRFRRLREHARGGLGEVFVALDGQLNREVALKEIREQFADEVDARFRFLREAEITGKLEHPGVVPVYGLGAYADGRPYYAMRFIRGESMQDAITRFHRADENPRRDPGERSLALREMLSRFVAVCQAVGYAHARGVIHRDLKPANVMLGEYGETLVVDWGLARLFDRPDGERTVAERPIVTGGGTNETQMGAVVGTPAFMPPEQAYGQQDQMGPASDVFALGATLYCLLTGKAPYGGYEALLQAAMVEYVPARQRNGSVPAALAAVCDKAMAKQREDRYATARALAEEVQRWLADEPVQAYREPVVERMRRWGRRHRTLASVGVALLLAGMLALGVGLWFVNAEKERTAAERNRAVEAEKAANANLGLAQENLKLAREAIDECYNVAYKDPLFQGPRMEKARNLLLRKTLRFYKNFRAQRPEDQVLQHEEALQWARVGTIECVLGRNDDGRQAYERARQLYQALVQTHPEVPEFQQDLASTHNNLGILLEGLGQRAAALTEYEQARSLRLKLVQALPELHAYQNELARTHHNLGGLLMDLGQRAAALTEYEQARSLRLKLVQAHPELPEYQQDLASTHDSLGNLLSTQGQRAEAVTEFRQARTLEQKLIAAHPELPAYQQSLAYTQNNLGKLLADLGQRAAAVKEFQQARTLLLKLVTAHPDLPVYQQDLASTHNNLGALLAAQGQRAEALTEYQQARTLLLELVQAHPEVPAYQQHLARMQTNLGVLLEGLGRRAEAVKECKQARTLLLELVQAHPELPACQQDLAGTHSNLGVLLAAQGQHPEALKEHQQARSLRLKLVQAHPELPEYQQDLAGTHTNLGALLAAQGQRAEAVAEYQLARALGLKLVAAHPDVPVYQQDLASTRHNLGLLLTDLGQRAEALKEHQQVLSLRLKLVQAHPELPEYQHDLAWTHTNVGNQLKDLGQHTEAVTEFQQAFTLHQKLVQAHPEVPAYQNDLAGTHYNLGNVLSDLGQRAEALKEYQQARTLFQKLVHTHPDVPGHADGLARTCFNRVYLLLEMNQQREALADLDECIRQADRLQKLDRLNPMSETYLLLGLPKRGALLARLGRREDADADWDRVLKIAPEAQRAGLLLLRADSRARAGDYLRAADEADKLASGEGIAGVTLYNLACIQALNAGAAARDAARPLPEREKRSQQYARTAVELLGRTAKAGFFRDPNFAEHLDKDDDLAALREREDYRAFRKALRAMKP